MPPEFSLQTVLDYRSTIVESLEIELGRLLREKQELEDSLKMLEVLEIQLWEELTGEQIGEMDLVHIDQIRTQLEALDKKKQELITALKTKVTEIHHKREEVIQARQDEETLEIVKEKEIAEFREELKRNQQKVQDDIYIAQAYQSRR